jgi:hypothetical protein
MAAFTLNSMPMRPISAVAFIGSPDTPESFGPPHGISMFLRMPAG